MTIWFLAISAVAAYLLGSLNFAIIISKVFLRDDIRGHGSGNAGSTNAYRVMGKKWALAVAVGDIAKGLAAVCLAMVLTAGTPVGEYAKLLAGLCVILGHVYPLYFGFKGGKGVMTTAAMLLIVDWRVGCLALAIFILMFIFTRYISLSSMTGGCTIPIWSFVFHRESAVFLALSLLLALLIVFWHRANIQRLRKGEESKFYFRKKNP